MSQWIDLTKRMADVRVTKHDEFTPRPSQPDLVGKPFRIVVGVTPFAGPDPFSRSSNWSYDADRQVLTVRVNVAYYPTYDFPGFRDDQMRLVTGLNIGHHELANSEHDAQNAFGAHFKVTHTEANAYLLVFAPEAHIWLDPAQPDLEIQIPAAPDVARAATPHLAVAISGVCEPFEGSRVIGCGMHFIDATIDEPIEIVEHVCMASATIDRVDLVGLKGAQEVPVAHWPANAK